MHKHNPPLKLFKSFSLISHKWKKIPQHPHLIYSYITLPIPLTITTI